jgi:hypothetical protein
MTCIQPLVVGVNGELVFRPVELNLDYFSLEDLVGQDHDAERLEELQWGQWVDMVLDKGAEAYLLLNDSTQRTCTVHRRVTHVHEMTLCCVRQREGELVAGEPLVYLFETDVDNASDVVVGELTLHRPVSTRAPSKTRR